MEGALTLESGGPCAPAGQVTSLYLNVLCWKWRIMSPALQSHSKDYAGCKAVSMPCLALTEVYFLPSFPLFTCYSVQSCRRAALGHVGRGSCLLSLGSPYLIWLGSGEGGQIGKAANSP